MSWENKSIRAHPNQKVSKMWNEKTCRTTSTYLMHQSTDAGRLMKSETSLPLWIK